MSKEQERLQGKKETKRYFICNCLECSCGVIGEEVYRYSRVVCIQGLCAACGVMVGEKDGKWRLIEEKYKELYEKSLEIYNKINRIAHEELDVIDNKGHREWEEVIKKAFDNLDRAGSDIFDIMRIIEKGEY